MSSPCSTCGRSYGAPVNEPGRCGICLTGLSLDGRPVYPILHEGKWVSPATMKDVAQLPDGTWTFVWSEELAAALGTTPERVFEETIKDREQGIW